MSDVRNFRNTSQLCESALNTTMKEVAENERLQATLKELSYQQVNVGPLLCKSIAREALQSPDKEELKTPNG